MFLSYNTTKYLGYDSKTKLYRWEYKLTDTDWEGVAVGVEPHDAVGVAVGVGVGVGVAVIQEYSKRNLPVAANLIRAFSYESKRYGYSIQQIVAWNVKYNPLYKDYEQEVEKYLTLL
jgi:hypothetical protein